MSASRISDYDVGKRSIRQSDALYIYSVVSLLPRTRIHWWREPESWHVCNQLLQQLLGKQLLPVYETKCITVWDIFEWKLKSVDKASITALSRPSIWHLCLIRETVYVSTSVEQGQLGSWWTDCVDWQSRVGHNEQFAMQMIARCELCHQLAFNENH